MSQAQKIIGNLPNANDQVLKSPLDLGLQQLYYNKVTQSYKGVGNEDFAELTGMDPEERKVLIEQYNELAT